LNLSQQGKRRKGVSLEQKKSPPIAQHSREAAQASPNGLCWADKDYGNISRKQEKADGKVVLQLVRSASERRKRIVHFASLREYFTSDCLKESATG